MMIDIKLPVGREVSHINQEIMPDGETVKIIINTRKIKSTQVVLNVITSERFIPKVGDHFRAEGVGSDKSWRRNVFKCIAALDDILVAKIVDRERNIFNKPINLVVKDYDFHAVSDDIVREVSK